MAYDKVRNVLFFNDPGNSKRVLKFDLTTLTESEVINTGGGTFPCALAIDTDTNTLYIGDRERYYIMAVDVNNTANTWVYGGIIGNNTVTGDGGPVSLATLGGIVSLTIDKPNKLMYVGSINRYRVVNMTSGIINAFAGMYSTISNNTGTGVSDFSGDGGVATNATFKTNTHPGNIVAVDSLRKRVYIADQGTPFTFFKFTI
jgi:hypothetical protein